MTLLGYYTKSTDRLLQDFDMLNEQVYKLYKPHVTMVTILYVINSHQLILIKPQLWLTLS